MAGTGRYVISEDLLHASIRAIKVNSALATQPYAVTVPLVVLNVAVEHQAA